MTIANERKEGTMVIKDPKMPHGITQWSMKFIDNYRSNIGKVKAIKITRQDETSEFAGWMTEVIGEKGILTTDGFAVGYGGEGPSGLKLMLELFGAHQPVVPSEVGLEIGKSYEWEIIYPRDWAEAYDNLTASVLREMEYAFLLDIEALKGRLEAEGYKDAQLKQKFAYCKTFMEERLNYIRILLQIRRK